MFKAMKNRKLRKEIIAFSHEIENMKEVTVSVAEKMRELRALLSDHSYNRSKALVKIDFEIKKMLASIKNDLENGKSERALTKCIDLIEMVKNRNDCNGNDKANYSNDVMDELDIEELRAERMRLQIEFNDVRKQLEKDRTNATLASRLKNIKREIDVIDEKLTLSVKCIESIEMRPTLEELVNYAEEVNQCHLEELEWYRRAAEQDERSAQNNLKNCYDVTGGISEDADKISEVKKEIENETQHLRKMLAKRKTVSSEYYQAIDSDISRHKANLIRFQNRIKTLAEACEYNIQSNQEKLVLDKVNFSAIARKVFKKDEFVSVNVIMYEEEYRCEADKIIAQEDEPVREVSSGIHEVERDSEITIILSSSAEVEIDESTIKQLWKGKYLNFTFLVCIPEDYNKNQIVFIATVYINSVIATKLKFVAQCSSVEMQNPDIIRNDIKSAFISYSSEDRQRVAIIYQGIKTARPDMDLFFDVDNLRRGEDWEKRLYQEIDSRDILYLCWSHNAFGSEWVNREWRRAFERGGVDKIEPIPLETPDKCPPPAELNGKHFNDKMLYYANGINLN